MYYIFQIWGHIYFILLLLEIEYLGATSAITKTSEELREEMDFYDHEYRGKSLLELHQEKKATTK